MKQLFSGQAKWPYTLQRIQYRQRQFILRTEWYILFIFNVLKYLFAFAPEAKAARPAHVAKFIGIRKDGNGWCVFRVREQGKTFAAPGGKITILLAQNLMGVRTDGFRQRLGCCVGGFRQFAYRIGITHDG